MHPRHGSLLALILGACSFEPRAVPLDSSLPVTDAALADAPLADAAPDARPVDAARPDAPVDAAPPDARPDAAPDANVIDATPPVDASPCGWPFLPTNFDPCVLPTSLGDVTIAADDTWDTDAPTVSASEIIAQSGAASIRVRVYHNLTISGANISVIGSHPLLIVVLGDFRIGGSSSFSVNGDQNGAGADDPTACVSVPSGRGTAGNPSGSASSGGGGGGGGSFGGNASVDTTGGTGGDGNGASKGTGGAGGTASADTLLSPLRGGCSGAKGGDGFGSNTGTGGAKGGGGGVIQISAKGNLEIDGPASISARGGGGAGGGTLAQAGEAGGGGAGSGGGIFLEANAVKLKTTNGGAKVPVLCANGGAGGAGAGSTSGGNAGSFGTCDVSAATDSATAGMGGAGGNGGFGGSGVADPVGKNGSPGPASGGGTGAGGGGGGGSVGRIRLRSVAAVVIDTNTIVTPAAVVQ